MLLLPPLCFPAVTFRMNSLHLVQTLKALEVPLPGRSVAQGKGHEDSGDTAIASLGDTSSAPASCPRLPPALHGSVVPLQHWLCQESPRSRRQLQQARLGSGTGSSPAQGATTAGSPRRAGTEGSKEHGGAKGQHGMGWGVPPWLARSIQPHKSGSKGDRSLDTALLARAGTHHQPGNAQHFSPAQVPLSLQHRSQIPPPSAFRN